VKNEDNKRAEQCLKDVKFHELPVITLLKINYSQFIKRNWEPGMQYRA
jgi:hypothetical protein